MGATPAGTASVALLRPADSSALRTPEPWQEGVPENSQYWARTRSASVKKWDIRRSITNVGTFLVGALLLLQIGGCPVDRDAVFTEGVRAGLDAAVSSFVDALAAYLAGN
jgi:hypothetical protein